MIKKIFILFGFLSMFALNAQSGNIGMNTTSPNATLEIKALPTNTNKGVLFPQLTDAEINAMSAPPEGLMVYNTDKKCLSIWGKRSLTDAVMQWSCLYQSSTSSGSSGFVNVIQMKPEFPRRYDDERSYGGYTDIIETADEGYLILGSTGNTPPNYMGQSVVIKTNKKGYVEWKKSFTLLLRRVIELPNGNYIFAGVSGGRGYTQITDQFGNIISSNTLINPSFPLSHFHDFVKLPNNTFVLVGKTFSADPPYNTKFYIRNIDINGNMIWERQISGCIDSQYGKIVADGNGNFYTTALTSQYDFATPNAYNNSISKIVVFKFDSNGNELWRKFASLEDYYSSMDIHGLSLAPDGNLLVSGALPKKLIKMAASDGSIMWSLYSSVGNFGGFIWNGLSGIISVVAYNSTTQMGIGKLDNEGNLLWVNTAIPVDRYGTVKPLSNGGYIYVNPNYLEVYKMNAAGQLIAE